MEANLNNRKWKIYYQSWIPFDEELNKYFEEQKNKYIKREIKRRRKKTPSARSNQKGTD